MRFVLESNKKIIIWVGISLLLLLIGYTWIGVFYTFDYYITEWPLIETLFLWSQTMMLFVIGSYLNQILFLEIFAHEEVQSRNNIIQKMIPLALSILLFLSL